VGLRAQRSTPTIVDGHRGTSCQTPPMPPLASGMAFRRASFPGNSFRPRPSASLGCAADGDLHRRPRKKWRRQRGAAKFREETSKIRRPEGTARRMLHRTNTDASAAHDFGNSRKRLCPACGGATEVEVANREVASPYLSCHATTFPFMSHGVR
jgi:hypothetical protein